MWSTGCTDRLRESVEPVLHKVRLRVTAVGTSRAGMLTAGSQSSKESGRAPASTGCVVDSQGLLTRCRRDVA